VADWQALGERAQERYLDGERRLPELDDADVRQRQLTRMGNAAYAAGLAALMADGDAAGWLARAAERYRESFADAPPGSWGRPIGAVKARLLADDWGAAADEARWSSTPARPRRRPPSAGTPLRWRRSYSAATPRPACTPTRSARATTFRVTSAMPWR
jgi:hypothetical protein